VSGHQYEANGLKRLTRSNIADGDISRATGEVALGGHDLVVVASNRQASSLPSVKVAAGLNGATGTLVDTDGPVLLERRGAFNAGLRVSPRGAETVRAAVAGDRAEVGRSRAGIKGAEVLHNVVLDKGVTGQAVDGEIAVAVGLVGGREANASADCE
jgi:hypothetical protein